MYSIMHSEIARMIEQPLMRRETAILADILNYLVRCSLYWLLYNIGKFTGAYINYYKQLLYTKFYSGRSKVSGG